MRCLVVGGAGFIGSYAVRELLDRGHSVVVYDALPEHNSFQRVWGGAGLDGITLVPGDVGDLAQLARTIRDHQVDHIVTLAAWQIPACAANPTAALRVNGIGFNNVLEAAALLGIERVVWASSNAVFGSPQSHQAELIPNDEPHRPNTVYGALKSLNEYMAQHYFDTRGVDSVGLRFGLVYGPGRMRGASTFASTMIESAATGTPCVVDNADSTVDWLYAVDAGRYIVAALEASAPQERCYNTAGDVRSVREAAAYLRELVPGAALDLRPGTINACWRLDSEHFFRDMGCARNFSMEQGLADAVRRVRERAQDAQLSAA